MLVRVALPVSVGLLSYQKLELYTLTGVQSYWRVLWTTSIVKYTVRFYTRATFFFKKELKVIFKKEKKGGGHQTQNPKMYYSEKYVT